MSFSKDLAYHPRRLPLRAALFQIHLWAGVLVALYLVVIALSGSVLVYKDELTRWALPPTLHAFSRNDVVRPEIVLSRFAVAKPGASISNLQMPSPLLPVFVATGKDDKGRPKRWIGDPTAGALRDAPRTWIDTLHDVHYYLLLPPSWGMQANGVGAAVLLLLAGSGIVLWWPGVRVWTRGLRINPRANWRRLNYDLHSAIGFWTLAIVVWWAISGVYFGWYREVTAAVSIVSPLRGMTAPMAEAAPVVPEGQRTSLDAVLRAASAVSPGGQLWSVSDPTLRGPECYVLLDRGVPGDFSHRDIVRVRTADAHVLSVWHYGERHSAGDWFLWLMHPLHFGTVWGPAVKLLWAVLGVSLAVLTLTGLLMYWNRFLRHRLRA